MTMNPAPLHLDHEYAEGTEFGRPLVNSMFTLALVVGLSVPELTLGTIVAQLGLDEVTFPAPVFQGDTVRVATEVVSARESRKRPDAGIVVFAHRARNQRDELVCSCKRHRPDAPAARMRVPRSLLFVPGARPDMVAKVPRWSPDAVAVDLEDAVAAGDKESARDATVRAVAELPRDGGTLVLIRVNGPTTPWYADDVAAVAGVARADGVVLPKLESPEQLEDLRAPSRRPPGDRGPRVGAGGGAVPGPAAADERGHRPAAAYFGAEDYIASVGGRRTAGGQEVLFARSEVVLAAAVAGVGLLDQAVVAAHDAEAFRADAAVGRDLGYDGKICIHPSQVALAHETFTPTDEEIAHARLVIEAGSSGVGVVDGEMVDAVHLTMARAVLSRAGVEA